MFVSNNLISQFMNQAGKEKKKVVGFTIYVGVFSNMN